MNFTALILLLLSTFAPRSPEPELHLLVTNIQRGKGSISVAVFQDQEHFFKVPLVSKTVRATADSLSFSVPLAPGTYAVAVYQDLNDNGKLDRGWFGIPTEPYGLSLNYRPTFSKPTFDDCKFAFSKPLWMTIYLK